jgi:hypothetical protein
MNTTRTSLEERFFLFHSPEETSVFCYDRNDELVMHSPQHPQILAKCEEIADSLDARLEYEGEESSFIMKCVREEIYERPDRILKLDDVRRVVESDPELQWGIQDRPSLPVRNSDGSYTMLKPFPGFFLKPSPRETFTICYEVYYGIGMHFAENPRVLAKCQEIARLLSAKLFKSPAA